MYMHSRFSRKLLCALALFSLLSAAFLSVWLLPNAATNSPIQADVQAVVLRVIDGDTLLVDIPNFPPIIGTHVYVRIASCDTPELKSKDPRLRAMAVKAKELTQSLAAPGTHIWLRAPRRDKYFRILAHVEANGVDVAKTLLAAGLALPYEGGTKKAFRISEAPPGAVISITPASFQ